MYNITSVYIDIRSEVILSNIITDTLYNQFVMLSIGCEKISHCTYWYEILKKNIYFLAPLQQYHINI